MQTSGKKIGIILARGGSKRLPGKNIKLLNGIPLINYTIRNMLDSKVFDDVIVYTDDNKIAQISIAAGANVPFLRTKKNASDTASSFDALRECIDRYIDEFAPVSYIVLAQATSPFTKPETFKLILEKTQVNNRSCISVVKSSKKCEWFGNVQNDIFLPILNQSDTSTQEQFLPSGNVYSFSFEYLYKMSNYLYEKPTCVELDEIEAIDIDTTVDFLFAEYIAKQIEIGDL